MKSVGAIRAGAVVMGLVAGCGKPGAGAVTPTSPPVVTGGVEPGQADAEAKKTEDATAAALARVPKILESVAKLRGLEFKAKIGAEHQDPEEFRKFVRGELDKELPRDKAPRLSEALHRVGFLPKPVNIRDTMENALVSQVGAYYDPKRSKFFVVMAAKQPMFADVMSAHELTHGLQDQHFDLRAYLGEGTDAKEKTKLSADEVIARRFVVEGEATFVMSLYGPYAMSGALLLENEQLMGVLDSEIGKVEKLTIDQMIAANSRSAQQASELGGDFAAAAKSFAELPRFITIPLAMPYVRGMSTVYRVYRKGGWEAVSGLYSDPPASSEQVLHPAEKLLGKRDQPIVVDLRVDTPRLEGWKVLDQDVLGELLWSVYLSTWDVDDTTASQGWGGDRYALLDDGKTTMGLFATVWDTEKDAKEFAAAYAKTLETRFGKPAGEPKRGVVQVERPDGTTVTVRRRGTKIAIADGAPAKLGLALTTDALKSKMKRARKK